MLYWGDFLDFFTLKLLIEGSNLSIGKLLTDSMQSPCVSNVLSTDEAVLLATIICSRIGWERNGRKLSIPHQLNSLTFRRQEATQNYETLSPERKVE
jgi:hypothetical protein